MNGEDDIHKLERLEGEAVELEHKLEEKLHEIKNEIEKIESHGPVPITVNNKPVTVHGHEHTGLQIKQAAIAAGVRIQLDYVLMQELSHGRTRSVGDDLRIHVEKDAHFEAIPNDDHS